VVARYIPGDGDTVGWIKFGSFRLAGQTFNAMDSGLPHKFSFTPAVNLFVTCESEDEFERLDAELSKGGSYLMKKGSYPFAEKYCWLSDRYGINWQLSYRGAATT
jgi:predicted 3-demethylubiquinone-9 3-methyltransferase (glyoxalase superfamily)